MNPQLTLEEALRTLRLAAEYQKALTTPRLTAVHANEAADKLESLTRSLRAGGAVPDLELAYRSSLSSATVKPDKRLRSHGCGCY